MSRPDNWQERVRESAQAFADVVGDNDELGHLYNAICDHSDLWARSEPVEARDRLQAHIHACIDAFAARLHEEAEMLADEVHPEWGADVDPEAR